MTLSSVAETSAPIVKPSSLKVEEFKTKGGVQGWFVATPNIPVLTVYISFKGIGEANEPKEKVGLVDYLTSMMDEGAGKFDSVAFKALLLEKNIQLKISSNSDDISFSLRCTKDNVSDLFDVLRLILHEQRFDEAALARVKEQIMTNLQQSLHSENSLVSDTFSQQAFKDHPYGLSIKQQIEGLAKVTKKDLQDYMSKWFTRDRIQLSAAGDISREDFEKRVDEVMEKLPSTGTEPTVKDVEPIYTGDVTVVEMDIPQSVILFYQPGIARRDKDFYASYILMKILGDGGFKSRLWDEVREKRGLAYGVDADLKWIRHTNYAVGSTATANEKVGEVIDIIRSEWKKMLEKGATQEELDFVKVRMIGSYPLAFTSTPQVVGALANYQQDDLGPDFINRRNDEIRKVTLDDVNRAAKKLLQPEKLSFIVVGKPKGLPSQGGGKK